MSQIHLSQQIEVSAGEALRSGEMERAEHLCASLVRLKRTYIKNLLNCGMKQLVNNACTICDQGYVPRNYLITAIVSTYKAARFLEGRIQDLLDQSIADQLEILVIDSASPQNEGKIVRVFQQCNSNIRYFRTDRRESVYQAWNRGVAAAKGRYLTNANTDDRLHPEALERLVAVLEQGVDVVYADSILTKVENETYHANNAYKSLQRPSYSRNALLESCITGSQPVWRKSLHDDIGYFDISYSSAGDYDFFIRAARKFKFEHIPETLGLVWTSPETFSGKGLLPNMEFYAIRERYHDLLAPTENNICIIPERVPPLAELLVLASQGGNQSIDDLIQNDHCLCHEFGTFCEQRKDTTNAWRYLQRAYYLAPDNPAYRESLEKVLKASLRSSVMDLTGCNNFLLSSDMLMTVALASATLGYPNVAAWHYTIALELEPENSATVVSLDKLLKEMQEGGVR